jgi:cytochrome c biogenesis protein
MKTGFSMEKCLKGWNQKPTGTAKDAEAVLTGLGIRKIEKHTVEGKEVLYGNRNRIGIWGAWMCHLGMLVIIAGFGLGQMLKTEFTVYGVAGQTKQVGDLNYEVTIDKFEILLREDETVEQYQAELTVTDTASGKAESGMTSVNHPLSVFGMKYYQNSTGWAANVSVYKGEELIQEELLCAGEYLETEGKEDLILMFRAFYPDHAEDAMGNHVTLTSALNNPAYLYALYYQDQVLGMNVLGDKELITVDDYTYIFHDPQPYTLIQVKRDPFTGVAGIGGLLVVAALILAFYVRPEEVWAVKQEDGTWAIAGKSRKGGTMFEEKILEVCTDEKNNK